MIGFDWILENVFWMTVVINNKAILMLSYPLLYKSKENNYKN